MSFVFYTDMSHVWTHPSGAKLFQGNREAVKKPASETGAQVLVVAAENVDPTTAGAGYRVRHEPLQDKGSMPPELLEWTKEKAHALAAGVAQDLAQGVPVLVCCWSGYNRSGLVVALAMTKCGVPAEEAINTLMERRNVWALNNFLFRDVIRGTR